MRRKFRIWGAWIVAALVVVSSLYMMVREVLAYSGAYAYPSSTGLVALVDRLLWIAFPVVFAIPAALIVSHQPRNVIGWLLMIPAVIMNQGLPGGSIIDVSTPPASPSFLFFFLVWFDNWNWIILMFPILFIPLFFPTGRLPSPRWRWVLYFAAAMVLVFLLLIAFAKELSPINYAKTWSIHNPIGIISRDFLDGPFFNIPWVVCLMVLTVTCVAALLVRFRRAAAVERAQIKWLLYACAVFAIAYAVIGYGPETGPTHDLLDIVFATSMMFLPVTIANAISRHRLFDIDFIIRKTLVYALLSGLLALVFFADVVIFQYLFTIVLGDRSPAAVVASTLAIAALFAPLRSWLQSFIDRRFFRQKYNAEKLLADFARQARNETDLDALTILLVDIVHETMQPDGMSVWMNRGRAKVGAVDE